MMSFAKATSTPLQMTSSSRVCSWNLKRRCFRPFDHFFASHPLQLNATFAVARIQARCCFGGIVWTMRGQCVMLLLTAVSIFADDSPDASSHDFLGIDLLQKC